MKILLATVPPWLPYHPYLSVPLLTGILRENGFTVVQKDYNVEFYDNLLSSAEIKAQFNQFEKKGIGCLDFKKQGLIGISDYLIERVDVIKSSVKQKETYGDEKMIQESFEVLDLILKSFSLNFPEIELALGEVKYLFDYYDIDKAFKYVYDDQNLFRYYFMKYHIQGVMEEKPDVVGFSVTTAEQLIPALTFAKVLQEHRSSIKIFLGGSYISKVAQNLIADDRFNKLIDCVLKGYAEDTIVELMREYESGKTFENIAGILYRQGNSVIDNPAPKYKFVKDVPFPTFDEILFDRYFSPHKKLPIELSKGCYWGKCRFCELNEEIYTAKSVERIFAEITFLHRRYGVNHFPFVSASPSPKLLYALATKIHDAGLNVTWSTMLRPEPYIDEVFARRLYDGGMRLAKIGFESGSQKMLDSMNKGLNTEDNRKVLHALYRAGISVHGYFMYGYHGETIHDIEKTRSFIEDEQIKLTSMATSFYTDIYRPANGLRIYMRINRTQYMKLKILQENERRKK